VKRPESIVVLGQRFTVHWEPYDAGLLNEPDKAGRTDLMQQVMHIRQGAGFHQTRETVLHELIHVCLNLVSSREHDEELVAGLAPVLLELLRRDGQLMDWLREPDE